MPSFTLAGHKLPWSYSRDCPWTLTPAEAQSNWIHPSAGIAIKSAAPDYTRNLYPQSKSRVRSQKPWDFLPDQLTQEHTEDTPKDTHLGEEQPSLLLVEHPTFSIREFHPFCVRLWNVSQRGISSSSVQLQGVWLTEKRWTRKQPEETSAPLPGCRIPWEVWEEGILGMRTVKRVISGPQHLRKAFTDAHSNMY